MTYIDLDKPRDKKKEINDIFKKIAKVLNLRIIGTNEQKEVRNQLGYLYERGKEDGISNLAKKFIFFLEEL